MSLILKAAHQFHGFFPFAQLRTANWILKRKLEWGVDAGQAFWT